MECVYRRRLNPNDAELRGLLKRTGGAFVLVSAAGVAIDRVYSRTSPSFFSGSLYVASTSTSPGSLNNAKSLGRPLAHSIPDPLPHRALRARRVPLPPPPEGSLVLGPQAYIEPFLARYFKAHQEEGIRFMFARLKHHAGVILADEMGLGKTLQSISILYLFCKIQLKVLVVAPCSLVGVWEREIGKWIGPSLRVFNGGSTAVREYRGRECVVILNYEKLLGTEDFLLGHGFSLVICDEAHRLRGEASQLLASLKRFHAAKKLLVTGTPFQNNLQEYRRLLSLADARAAEAKSIEELSSITRDAVLKRSVAKTAISLPTKTEVIHILANCGYPEYLSFYNSLGGPEKPPGIKDIQALRTFLQSSRTKWAFVTDLLAKILASKASLVVVTRYVEVLKRMHEEIKKILHAHAFSLSTRDILLFYGDMSPKERDQVLASFESPGQKVFILTAKAGGEGLTLTKATEMIIFDSDWNPANDLQVMGRVWRIGQAKPVSIHRIFVMGTIEEHILVAQLKKIQMQRGLERGAEVRADLSEPTSFLPSRESIAHRWARCQGSGPEKALKAFGYAHRCTPYGIAFTSVT